MNIENIQRLLLDCYEFNGYKILSIYHPSPISPKNYKDNVPIFERLKSIIENNYLYEEVS